MNFINSLTKHAIVEINKSVGLLNGHVVAQAPYRQVADETFLDNGWIMFLDDAAELVIDAGHKAQPFLHYTEELMTGPVIGAEYFTVDLDDTLDGDKVCYPRAIALYEGDEFTTNNFVFASGVAFGAGSGETEGLFAVLNGDGKLEVRAAAPTSSYEGPLFKARKEVLPVGAAYTQGTAIVAAHLTVLNKHLSV